MKVLIAGGGTGGHIYPALTIADAIRHKVPDAEITFVGTRKGTRKGYCSPIWISVGIYPRRRV